MGDYLDLISKSRIYRKIVKCFAKIVLKKSQDPILLNSFHSITMLNMMVIWNICSKQIQISCQLGFNV